MGDVKTQRRVRGETVSPGRGEKAKRWILTALIAFNLLAIFSYAIPTSAFLFPTIKAAVAPYMLWSGLFQAWDMFSPNPPNVNTYLDATVTYRDGKTRVWSFPRMEQLGLVQRYFKERYRKWANDRVRLDMYSATWPDVARYIARQMNTDPKNPPVNVALVRHWTDIPPPGQPASPGKPHSFLFYLDNVFPGDLK